MFRITLQSPSCPLYQVCQHCWSGRIFSVPVGTTARGVQKLEHPRFTIPASAQQDIPAGSGQGRFLRKPPAAVQSNLAAAKGIGHRHTSVGRIFVHSENRAEVRKEIHPGGRAVSWDAESGATPAHWPLRFRRQQDSDPFENPSACFTWEKSLWGFRRTHFAAADACPTPERQHLETAALYRLGPASAGVQNRQATHLRRRRARLLMANQTGVTG